MAVAGRQLDERKQNYTAGQSQTRCQTGIDFLPKILNSRYQPKQNKIKQITKRGKNTQGINNIKRLFIFRLTAFEQHQQ